MSTETGGSRKARAWSRTSKSKVGKWSSDRASGKMMRGVVHKHECSGKAVNENDEGSSRDLDEKT